MKCNCLVCLLIAVILLAPAPARAEEKDVSDMEHRERIFVGGMIGLQLGTLTAVSINLHGGYRLTNRLSAGIGGMYQYANDRWFGESYSSHVYGGSVFARFGLAGDLFLHAEYERLQVESRLSLQPPDERPRITEQNYLLGAGYGLRLSESAVINLMLLYNFNDDSQVHFSNPFMRVGIDIYF